MGDGVVHEREAESRGVVENREKRAVANELPGLLILDATEVDQLHGLAACSRKELLPVRQDGVTERQRESDGGDGQDRELSLHISLLHEPQLGFIRENNDTRCHWQYPTPPRP